MSRFLKKTMRLFFVHDLYGYEFKKKTAKRSFERVAAVMEAQPMDYFFISAFDSVGKNINRAISKGLDA